jgi:UDP-N-acetylmuramoyl-L-alanyl-D-glutamate--2,6-diaminopimelate ligase
VDREQAIGKALALARSGDVVLIAGKGHENFQEFASTIIPFDDRAVAARLLKKD